MPESTPHILRLRLPATSANLGAAFDCAAVALAIYLEIEAEAADGFSIEATGRDAEQCSRLDGNLILEAYARILKCEGKPVVALKLTVRNEIPLGMGCGSSAAGRLAAIMLANHFGGLGWTGGRILSEAAVLEGHPDNAAACWLGGFVASSFEGQMVHAARVDPPAEWRAMIVMPENSLATSRARAVLPTEYPRSETVANIQAATLLGLAFSQGRADLLRPAMADRIHQPYRSEICPLLAPLLPLAGSSGILGVALSGAGPSVLLILKDDRGFSLAEDAIRSSLAGLPNGARVEILTLKFEREGAGECKFDQVLT